MLFRSKVIKEMFEASVDGQPYDTERWGQYFRPAGVQAPGSGSGHSDEDTPAPAPAVKLVSVPKTNVVEEDPPFDTEDAPAASAPVVKSATASSDKAQDILAMIRARQAK